jgi:ATP-dependent DNA helicase
LFVDVMMSYLEKTGFRLAPSLTCLIYYGDNVAREEMMRKVMLKTISSDFPIIVTSDEIAMSDAKLLAPYNWKYVVFDEVMEKQI